MKEIYKDVLGFENIYKISNFGNLKSYKVQKTGRILKQTNKTGSYFSVVMCYKGKSKSTRIHRLVAEHFIPNPKNLKYINHKDGNKQNNNVSNLEWVTAKANVAHSIRRNPRQLDGMIYYNKFIRPKKVYQYRKDGTLIAEFPNCAEASKSTGVCQRNILQVANKEPFNKKGSCRKQAGGFVWSYERRWLDDLQDNC